MHGSHPARCALFLLPLLLPLFVGCDTAHPGPAEELPLPTPEAGSAFDPVTAGTIRGQVIWSGDQPKVALIAARYSNKPSIVRENPNAPAIHPPSGGVGGAVVFLRDVDPRHARPWDHPPVRVEQRDHRLHICQGTDDSQRGFVRRGETIEMVSTQPIFHALRAAGAASFTLSFPDPEQPLSRRLVQRGVVELSSAAEFFWMRAYLFVDDHPYYAQTDAEGRFSLERVPPGRYRIACWLPNWQRERQARNPETAEVMRWEFRPPVEMVQPVVLGGGEARGVRFIVSKEMFEPGVPRVPRTPPGALFRRPSGTEEHPGNPCGGDGL